MTRIIRQIDIAVKEILTGNVIALPTETVYGLGTNALNENAVIKIFEIKDRPRFNPLIVHVYNRDDLKKYGDVPEKVFDLAEKFSPGPITYIVKKKTIIPDIVTSGSNSVGLRIPSHTLFREILRETSLPISAPSANMFGRVSPTSAEEVLKELNGKINYVLDGGKCEIGIESTVISFMNDQVEILRNGYITKEDIEKVIGKVTFRFSNEVISPGMLSSHYAPVTPLYVVENVEQFRKLDNDKIGILDFTKFQSKSEIALYLFSEIRKLDEAGYDFLVCEKADDEELGAAINERLMKACSGNCIIADNKFIFTKK